MFHPVTYDFTPPLVGCIPPPATTTSDPCLLRFSPAPSRLRSSRSHESLLSGHSMVSSTELGAGEVTIKPLHSSILGQEHCIQISSPSGTRYYSCRSADERDRWIHR